MNHLKFEWDKNKDKINRNQHSISFAEAKTVFYDEYAILFDDPDHSQSEERFLLLGLSLRLKTLVVCHCFRKEETTIRIISARKANKDEEQVYWSQRK